MRYYLGVEDIEPNHWVAYVFDLPGCFSSAKTQEGAMLLAPARIAEYFDWRTERGRPSPLTDKSIQTRVDETFRAFPAKDDPDYTVNAFFKDDRRALTPAEIGESLWLLEQTRADLLAVVEQVPPAKRRLRVPNFTTIKGILMHVAWAEWWYFSTLGLSFEREKMPKDPMAALKKVRAHNRATLPQLAGDTRVVEHNGEAWSARKIVRRTLWHERDHTQQIEKLVNA